MRIAFFYHSLLSDWNHGNAHFLRGIATELIHRGHALRIFEPEDGWSYANLLSEPGGRSALEQFRKAYPALEARFYRLRDLDLDEALEGADLVLVHEWNDPELVARLGRHRRQAGYRLLLHDTHHRAASDAEALAAFDLRDYDGVLAYGESLRSLYLDRGWIQRAWTWHEAADTRVFRPGGGEGEGEPEGDLVWVGNWGDGARARELEEFLIGPAADLKLRGAVHGVRYPEEALQALSRTGLEYRGWLPNFRVPEAFGRHRLTVHVPRRPYADALPGIPTIRPFEALACGIPLVSAPWSDTEGLFREGEDYLAARDGAEMRRKIRDVLSDPDLARALSKNGLETIAGRHTCAHRVDELLAIHAETR